MKPKDTKRAINQLIGDIQDNEWYCIQDGSESELKDWENDPPQMAGAKAGGR